MTLPRSASVLFIAAGLATVAVAACAHEQSSSSTTTVTSAPASPATVWTTGGGPASPGAPSMGDTVESHPTSDAGVQR